MDTNCNKDEGKVLVDTFSSAACGVKRGEDKVLLLRR